MRLADKTSIVTGGASGIGRAICILFAQEGSKIAIADVNDKGGESTTQRILKNGGSAIFVHTDVTLNSEVEKMVNEVLNNFGSVDIVVNVAGGAKGGDVRETDIETFDRNIDLNLKSVFFCTKSVLPVFERIGSGVIVNISSVNAIAGIGEVAYSAAKAGVISLTQNTAVRYGPMGVRANVICLGTIDSGPAWKERKEKDPNVLDRIAQRIPRKKVGTPEEVAYIALFLASDESGLINGATIVADGGWSTSLGTVVKGIHKNWYDVL